MSDLERQLDRLYGLPLAEFTPARNELARTSVHVLAEERQDVFGFGVVPEHRFCEEQFTVEVNVEDAIRPGNDLDSVEHLLPLLENARNQTGRVWQRPSGDAVLDPDTMPHAHRRHRSLARRS